MKTALKQWLHAQLVAPLFKPMGGSDKRSLRQRRGVALILALLFIVLLTVLVVEFSYETQVDASLATNSSGDLEAYLAAKSAVAEGMSLLWDHLVDVANGDEQPATNSGSTTTTTTTTTTQGAPSGEPYDSKEDEWATGVPFEQLNDATMRVSISDEYGKINLNALLFKNGSGPMIPNVQLINTLHKFFEARFSGLDAEDSTEPSMFDDPSQANKTTNKPKKATDTDTSGAVDPVDAILDWLDNNDDDNVRTDGAEDDYYMGLQNPYHCKNGPMDSIEELLLIKGITPEIYFGDKDSGQLPLNEFLTVHGEWGGAININTASEVVINSAIFALSVGSGGASGTPNQSNQLLDQLQNGPIYQMSQLQQGGLAYNPSGSNSKQNGNGSNPGYVDANHDGKDDRTGLPINNVAPNNPLNSPLNPKSNGKTFGKLQVPGHSPFLAIEAALPRPQAILDGLWTTHAAITGSFDSSVSLDTKLPRMLLAIDANHDGKDDTTGAAVPVDLNGDGIDDITHQPIQPSQGSANGLFIISSNCFRIYGDGMSGNVLVRIEAYVWRNPTITNPQAGQFLQAEMQRLAPPQVLQDMQSQTTNDTFSPGQTHTTGTAFAPAEHFRILDWKVIR